MEVKIINAVQMSGPSCDIEKLPVAGAKYRTSFMTSKGEFKWTMWKTVEKHWGIAHCKFGDLGDVWKQNAEWIFTI